MNSYLFLSYIIIWYTHHQPFKRHTFKRQTLNAGYLNGGPLSASYVNPIPAPKIETEKWFRERKSWSEEKK